MTPASRPSVFQPLGKEYESFLYAVVRDESNGSPLTMISVIARSGKDPWLEAARLSQLPGDAALQILERMIEDRSNPAREQLESDRRARSAQLLALLSGPATLPVVVPPAETNEGAQILIILALFASLMLASVFATLSYPAGGEKNTDPAAALAGFAAGQVIGPRNEIPSDVLGD